MMPLIVLVAVTVVAYELGAWRVPALHSWPAAVRLGLAAMFCFTALSHFTPMRHDLVRMLPPWVPYPEAVIVLTGVCELLGGIGLLVPRTRRSAAIALVLFLVAVFPANVHAAQAGLELGGRPVTPGSGFLAALSGVLDWLVP